LRMVIRNFWQAATPQRVLFATMPTAVILNQDTSQADPVTTGPVRFVAQIAKSELASVTAAQIESALSFAGSTVGGTLDATVTSLSPSAFRIDVDVSGVTSNGTIVVSIPANQFANTPSVSYDNTVTFGP
jgi:hypothetical protein